MQIKGAFLWDDPDQDQWSEITRIMVDQMNRWIHSGQGFIGSFDLPWSKLSQNTDTDGEHLKGTDPKTSITVLYAIYFSWKWYITWPFISIFLQKNLLEQILKLGSSVPNIISKSVKDQFELCLVKCRTSSKVTKLIYIYKLHDYLHCIYM